MVDFLKTYPYLVANIPLVFVMIISVRFAKPREYGLFSYLSGLMCIPVTILALLHNTSYWNPIRLGGGSVGIEDIAFTFIAGSMAWLLAAFPYRHRLIPRYNYTAWMKRSLLCFVMFGVLALILWIFGVKSLENTLISGFIPVLILLLLRPNLWPLAVNGLLLFTPIYILIVKIQLLIWPGYLSQWNHEGILGASFLGVPVGEIVFASVFGICWPIYIAFVLGIGLAPSSHFTKS